MKNLIFGAVIMKINSPEVFEFRLSTKNLLAMQNSKLFSFSNLLQMWHYRTKYRINSVFTQEI